MCKKMIRLVIAITICMSVLIMAEKPCCAGVTVSTSVMTNSWPGPDTPIITTYSDPTVLADANYRVLENFGSGRGVSQTFTIPAGESCTLTKIAIIGLGGAQSATYSIHLYDISGGSGLPNTYTPATDGPDPNTDSFENCTFTTPPGSSAEFIIFTFTGRDMALLQANHTYAVEIWGPTNVPFPGYWYWDRGISTVSTYPDGDGYHCDPCVTDPNTLPANTLNLRVQLSGGSRDCGLAVYGTLFNGKAYGPEPWDGQEDINTTPLLSWQAGEWSDASAGHNLYLGTDYDAVNNADTGTIGIFVGNVTDTNYQIVTPLTGIDYYWRVDEINDANTNSPWKGDVWHFVTTNTPPIPPSYSTGTVYYNLRLQQLEGFGAAACYDATSLTSHSQKETLYDLFFRDLGLDVLRIKNTYESDPAFLTATAEIVSAARQAGRNPDLKTELVPWSPPASLKSNGSINSGTLKKDANDANNSAPYYYVYNAYASWWLNSLTEPNGWAGAGIYPDYISIQNEPDWEATYDACKFLTTETSSYAGYDKAFEAVYNKLDGNVSPMPKIIAPESVGFGSSQAYITALNNRSQLDNIYGFSFHLYGDGNYDNPDGYLTGMLNYADSYGYKPLFMTEFIANGTPTLEHAINLAWHIHNCLYYLGVTSYYHWSMFRGSYTTGGIINLDSSSTYIIRDLYWFLKAYAYYTDPNWYVVDCSTNPSDNLRMSAFNNPDYNQLTIVVLNKSSTPEYLTLSIEGFSPDSNTSEIYQSSASVNWLSLGAFDPCEEISLPAESITTIHISGERQFTTATGNAAKCAIKAGKIQGQDSFKTSGTFTDFSPGITDYGTFEVNIVSADGNEIYSESNDFTVSDPVKKSLKYTHKIRGSQGAISSLKFDFNKNTFSINASKIDLTGLACPLVLNITINGGYLLSTEVNELIVNGSKKPIPTRLMRTYDDKLVVTKAKPKHNSTTALSDSLSVKGDIAVADINNTDMEEPNLVNVDVNFVWGDQTFIIPAGNFISAKTGHSYKCSKVLMDTNDCNAGFVTAKIDLDKCIFTASVKNADGLDAGLDDGIVRFGINFGDDDFNQPADVNVITGRSY